MKLWAITHGKKSEGTNPGLTEAGKEEIRSASYKLVGIALTSVVIGTGKRFLDTFQAINTVIDFDGAPIKYSPFLGSADSGKKAETGFDVLLADGTPIHDSGYIGLIGTPGVDLWAFLEGALVDESLIVTGREFIGAFLGGADNANSSAVYEIDTTLRTVVEVG